MIGLMSCTASPDPKSAETGVDTPDEDTAVAFEGWNVMADKLGKGVLLSAWSDGDEVIFVGGDMDAGPGVLARYDGERLCTENNVADRALWWIHGPREGEWYAVGEAGRVVHSVDGARSPMDVPTEATLFGVWSTETSLIAVGGHTAANLGEIWRYDGTTWTPLATELAGTVFKIYEDWVIGVDILYKIDGLNLIAYPAMGRLLTARGRAADDVWAVGGFTSSLVVHWDGTAWSEVDSSGVGQPLNGVWTGPGEDVWVAGNFGTTMVWDGTDWRMPSLPISSEHFHAVWKHEDEVLWAGGNLFSRGDNYGTIARFGDAPKTLEATPCD
jgi:hypothetical protein